MKFGNLHNFKNGWVVGDFTPSLFNSSDNDIGILYVKEGDNSDGHFHKHHTEYNIIISGKVNVDGRLLSSGDIFIYEPYDKSDVTFLSNTSLVVIKNPATKNDKHYS